MPNEFTKKEIGKKLNQAINLLLENDSYLLVTDVNERSISHRMAMYLQELFKDWDVDCEYNRDGHDAKILNLPSKKSHFIEATEDYTVFPDIIVHHRGRGTGRNLLVIEIKKTTSQIKCDGDIDKLKAFKKELGYCYRVFIKLRTGCDDFGVELLEFID